MCSVVQHVHLQCTRHIQSKKNSLCYICFASSFHAQVVAATSLFVALKLHASHRPIVHTTQCVANTFSIACYERLRTPHKTRELIDHFQHLRHEKARDKKANGEERFFKAAWKVLPLS
jgi:predicted choloylglycine hydrolase